MVYVVQRRAADLETEADAYEFLEQLRWGDDGPTECPHCRSDKGAWFLTPKDPDGRKSKGGSTARSQRRVWKCRENSCRRQFSVLTNTVMHATKMPVRAWVGTIFDLCTDPAGVSARDIATRWDVTTKSAWAMLNRIEEALASPDVDQTDLSTHAPIWFELELGEDAEIFDAEARARAEIDTTWAPDGDDVIDLRTGPEAPLSETERATGAADCAPETHQRSDQWAPISSSHSGVDGGREGQVSSSDSGVDGGREGQVSLSDSSRDGVSSGPALEAESARDVVGDGPQTWPPPTREPGRIGGDSDAGDGPKPFFAPLESEPIWRRSEPSDSPRQTHETTLETNTGEREVRPSASADGSDRERDRLQEGRDSPVQNPASHPVDNSGDGRPSGAAQRWSRAQERRNRRRRDRVEKPSVESLGIGWLDRANDGDVAARHDAESSGAKASDSGLALGPQWALASDDDHAADVAHEDNR